MDLTIKSLRGHLSDLPLVNKIPWPGLGLVLVVVGVGLALVAAYLVATGQWFIALGLAVAIPGLIILHNYPVYSLFIWILVAQFLMVTDSEMLRRTYWIIHRGLPLITVVIIAFGAMTGVSRRKLPKLGWVELAMLAYVGLSLASIALLTNDPSTAIIWYYDRVIVPIFLYLIVRLIVTDEKELEKLLPAILVMCLIQGFFAFVYIFARGMLPSSWLRDSGDRATGSLNSVSVYGATVIFAGLLLLHAALSTKVKDHAILRLIFIGAFALAMAGAFFSFSRANWIAMFIAALGMFFLYPRFMTKLFVVAIPVSLVLAGGILASQLEYASQRLYSGQSEESALSRLPVVYASLRMFEQKPLFGWGYSNFDDFDREFQGRVGDFVAPEKDHASHNLYLTILAEQGLLGLITYLAPALGLFVVSIAKWRDLPDEGFWSKKLLVILWLVIIVHFIVNNFSNMRVVYGLGLWWMTLGFIAALIGSSTMPADEKEEAPVPVDHPILYRQ